MLTDSRLKLFSNYFAWLIIVVCAFPAIIKSFGIDWTINDVTAGLFTHNLLEFIAFSTALFTVFFAFTHFYIKRDVVTPVLGLALFASGLTDLLHILACNGFMGHGDDLTNVTAFTWSLSRISNSLICLIGVAFLLRYKRMSFGKMAFNIFFGLALMVVWVLPSSRIPQAIYPDAFFVRPWDLIPLFAFTLGSIVFLQFYKRFPSTFAWALLLSSIPNIFAQLYMVLGATNLYDHHFISAHSLKIVAYVVPLSGLIVDYIKTYLNDKRMMHQLQVEISKRIEVEKELHLQARELQKSQEAAIRESQLKSDFVANVSHEIRTPMTAILGLTQLLKKSNVEDQHKEKLEIIEVAGDSLLSLINDLLDLSKVNAGELKVEATSFNIRDLIEDCARLIDVKVQEKPKLKLAIEVDWEVPVIGISDPLRLKQILLNLLGNAVKFTDKGTVRLHVNKVAEGNGLCFQVQDTGIGISQEKMANIFDKFFQADSSTSRKFGGTGLGLTITRHLVRLLHGDITVASQEGEGTTFDVKIPMSFANEAITLPEAQANNKITGLRVLIVDDVAINRLLVKEFLKHLCSQIEEAGSGEEAFEKFKAGKFDVVFLDLQMPGRDGYSIVADIRSWELVKNAQHTPVVAFTAYATSEEKDKALSLGFDDYLTKPINEKALQDTLERVVSRPRFQNLGGFDELQP